MEELAFIGTSWYAWLFAGVVAIAVGVLVMVNTDPENKGLGCVSIVGLCVVVFAFIFGVMAAVSSYTTVQRGTVGLVSRFGALTGTVFQPGLHWKTPFIESVEVFDTTQQSYEMSAHPDTSQAQWTDYSVGSQTSDGQSVDLSATVIFRVPDGKSAVAIRQNIGSIEEVVQNVVKANTRSITRNTSKLYSANQLYSGDITEFQEDVREQLEGEFSSTGEGLILVDFKVRGIGFEEKYSDAVEAKQIAAERIVTEENNANAAVYEARKVKELAIGEADAAIERARGQAESVKINADADAYAVTIDADAQAYATLEIGMALRKYKEVLQLRFIENLNSQTLFLPSDGFQFLLPLPE
jgi:regulator of protease activity HflC (stomatin/prohibitin superfamily)